MSLCTRLMLGLCDNSKPNKPGLLSLSKKERASLLKNGLSIMKRLSTQNK